MATVLDPRSQQGVTITILMPSTVRAAPILNDSLNAEPDFVGALVAAREFRMDNRYLAFWEWLERLSQDMRATFRQEEVPPPVAAYFRRLDE